MNICAYIGMTGFNFISMILSIKLDRQMSFSQAITEVMANFLLDMFTIGVTLYLNIKASSQHKLQKRLKEEQRRAKLGSHTILSSFESSSHSTNRLTSQHLSDTSGMLLSHNNSNDQANNKSQNIDNNRASKSPSSMHS